MHWYQCFERYSLVCGHLPFADAPPIIGGKEIWKVLLCFHRIVFGRVSVASHDVIRSSVFLRMSDKPLYSVFSGVYIVFVDYTWLWHELARESPLRSYALYCLLLYVLVVDVSTFELAQLVRVNVFDCRRRWLFVCAVGVTPLALSDFDLRRLIFCSRWMLSPLWLHFAFRLHWRSYCWKVLALPDRPISCSERRSHQCSAYTAKRQ